MVAWLCLARSVAADEHGHECPSALPTLRLLPEYMFVRVVGTPALRPRPFGYSMLTAPEDLNDSEYKENKG